MTGSKTLLYKITKGCEAGIVPVSIPLLYTLFGFLLLTAIASGCSQETAESERIHVYQDDISSQLAITAGNNLITILNYAPEQYKPSFFPVNTRNGIRINRGWPADPSPFEAVDHPHQLGLWLNFGDVNGYDFWNNSDSIAADQKIKYGRILTDSVVVTSVNDSVAGFSVYTSWISGRKEILLREKSDFIVKIREDSWLMERITTLVAQEDIHFSDNKEGLFALRLAREFRSDTGKKEAVLNEELQLGRNNLPAPTPKSGQYTGSSGLTGDQVWGTKNQWVMVQGIKDNDSISIMMMDHPGNFNHPPHWHARDYGLFSINNLGQRSFQQDLDELKLALPEGEELIFRHGMVVKNGGFLKKSDAGRIFGAFSD